MGRRERLVKYKEEAMGIFRGVKSESDFLEASIDEISTLASDSDFSSGADFDDGFKITRMRLSEAWWRVHQLSGQLEDVMRRCDRELEKAVARLEQPDRSDEGWEAHHAEYLKKMTAYDKAARQAHGLFLEWRAYYKKYIEPYRAVVDQGDSSN